MGLFVRQHGPRARDVGGGRLTPFETNWNDNIRARYAIVAHGGGGGRVDGRDPSPVGGAFLEACTPGCYNQEGKVGDGAPGGLAGESYGPDLNPFNALLAAWREKGDLEGLEITTG